MANDLVHWGKAPDEPGDDGKWDLPPIDPPSRPLHTPQTRRDARDADADARAARAKGDTSFAVQREGDAGDLRQSRWDWGDARTWLIIAALCFGFFAVSALVYFLPYGRHNQNDGPAPTPTIRVY